MTPPKYNFVLVIKSIDKYKKIEEAYKEARKTGLGLGISKL